MPAGSDVLPSVVGPTASGGPIVDQWMQALRDRTEYAVENGGGGSYPGSGTGTAGNADSGKGVIYDGGGRVPGSAFYGTTDAVSPSSVEVMHDRIKFTDSADEVTYIICSSAYGHGTRSFSFGDEAGTLTVATREWCRSSLLCIKRLTANEDRSATTTLTDLTELNLALGVGSYHFRFWLDVGQTSTGGYKWDLNFTGTATVLAHLTQHDQEAGTGAVVLIRRITSFASSVAVTTAATTAMRAMVEGVINVTVGGTFSLRFAQNSAAGVGTVRANSIVTLTPIPS